MRAHYNLQHSIMLLVVRIHNITSEYIILWRVIVLNTRMSCCLALHGLSHLAWRMIPSCLQGKLHYISKCVSATISLFIITIRDPDRYRFRTVPIPVDFFDAPHSSNAEIITFNSSDTGLPTMSWYFCV
jgi:hypothetical protein